jgi:CRP-like cAMP-binding protein
MPRITSTEVIDPKSLSAEQRHQLSTALYAVHRQIFDGVKQESFTRYVVESKAEHTWIQVHRNEEGAIVGYFALHIFERQLGGQPSAVLRAEAGSLRAYRGGSITMRFGLKRLLRYLLENPGRKAYYLGSLVHPSSYTLLAHHFGAVWPRAEQDTPPELLAFMDGLASEFGLEAVDAVRPLVRHVGWRTRETEVEREYWQGCDKPAARFFLEANPGYGEGLGLLTLVPLTAANVLRLARTVGARMLRQPVEALKRLARRLPGAGRLRRAEVVRQLQAAPLFAPTEARALEALAAHAEVLALPAGRYVFRMGDSSDALYLLARGAAYVLVEGETEEQVVDELGSGAVFGEQALLAGERRSASIRTATASTLVRIPRAALLPLLETHAHLRRALWQTFAGRRFDDLARESARYGTLGRRGRLEWLQRGEHRELAARESLAVEPGTSLLVLSAPVELHQARTRVATRGAVLVEASDALRLVARERTQVILLPREAA